MSEDKYGVLFELTQDAVAEIEMTDGVPVVRGINPAFVDVFGYDRSAIVGESLNEFIVPEYRRDEAVSFDRRTADGKANWATVSRRTADGVKEFLYRGIPFDRGDRSHGLAIYTDLTDEHRLAEHHQVLHRILRHNLGNELSRIDLLAESLLGETDEAVIAERARQIRGAVNTLDELRTTAGRVGDVLGEAEPEHTPVDLVAMLDDLVDQYRDATRLVDFESELPDRLAVTADHRLPEAIDALVENAVEHSTPTQPLNIDQSGPVDPDERATVRLAARADDGMAVVTVTDDGPGIPTHVRDAVFDDLPISQLAHNVGIGLWLTKWLVESYGGRLGYERADGRTTVTATVPLADGAE